MSSIPMASRAATHRPSFDSMGYEKTPQGTGSKWNPKNWGKKGWIIAGCVAVVVIVAVVVGAVEGTKANEYPSYSALNYTLNETYSGTDFFDMFNYYSDTDPSAGYVQYVNKEAAEWYNLTYATSDSAVIKVDTSETFSNTSTSTTGRMSVRITSKTTYDKGLFIFDVAHAPYGCGTWPALWLTDPDNWPEHGEIDVMEAVNQGDTGNQMTLHTSSNCKMNVKRKGTGTVAYQNCANGTNDNAGCGVKGKTATYGEEFNANGGGYYATEWRSDGIRVWFFDRDDAPSDINGTSPDPSGWGEALADFPDTHCDIDTHFKNQSIIANIDLCGSWAGAASVYSDEYGCPSSCTNYVASNASAFTEAYWEFKSFKVYSATN